VSSFAPGWEEGPVGCLSCRLATGSRRRSSFSFSASSLTITNHHPPIDCPSVHSSHGHQPSSASCSIIPRPELMDGTAARKKKTSRQQHAESQTQNPAYPLMQIRGFGSASLEIPGPGRPQCLAFSNNSSKRVGFPFAFSPQATSRLPFCLSAFLSFEFLFEATRLDRAAYCC
jgi:hypothetical protein